MIRMLIWRLFFEILHLVRAAFGPGQPRAFYFAFGANLDPQVLERRKIKVFNAREFMLKDFALRFSHQGSYRGMGFASIEASLGARTYGLLYEISCLDALRLDFYEGAWFINRYRKVNHHQDGIDFYFYQTRSPRIDLQPTDDYLNKMLRGFARLSHVPSAFLDWLKGHSTIKTLSVSDDVGFCFRVPDSWPQPLVKILRGYDQFVVGLFAKYVRDWSPATKLIRHEHTSQQEPDGKQVVFDLVERHRRSFATQDIAALQTLATDLKPYTAIPEVAAFYKDLIAAIVDDAPNFNHTRNVNVSGSSGILIGHLAAPYNKSLGLECLVYNECYIPKTIAEVFPSVARPIRVRLYSQGFQSDLAVAIFPENFTDAGVIPIEAKSFYFIDKFTKRCREKTIPFVRSQTTLGSLRLLKAATDEEIGEVAALWVHLHEHFHRQGILPLPQALNLKSSRSTAGLEELRVDLLSMLACSSEVVRQSCNAALLEEFILAERLFRYGMERCPNTDYDSRGAHIFYRYLERNGAISEYNDLIDVDLVRFRQLARDLSRDIERLETEVANMPIAEAKTRLAAYVQKTAAFNSASQLFPRGKFYAPSKCHQRAVMLKQDIDGGANSNTEKHVRSPKVNGDHGADGSGFGDRAARW